MAILIYVYVGYKEVKPCECDKEYCELRLSRILHPTITDVTAWTRGAGCTMRRYNFVISSRYNSCSFEFN